MKKIIMLAFIIGSMFTSHVASATTPVYDTGINVTSIAPTTAQVQVVIGSDEYTNLTRTKQSLKIQWRPWMCGDDQIPNQACPMIYIQPFVTTLDYDSYGNLLPVVLTNLQPNTKYRVWLGHDNGVRCITTPCDSDTWQNKIYSFTTLSDTPNPNPYPNVQILTKKMYFGVRGTQVNILETFLKNKGYMSNYIDSYYGTVTHAAIMKFQKDNALVSDGIVGPATRALINQMLNTSSNYQSYNATVGS